MRRTGILALPPLLLLCGCAAQAPAPAQAPAVDVPAGWSAADAAGAAGVTATALDDWWRRFGDPPLNTWVRRALLNNPRVNTAQAALREARARQDTAAAALAPTLDASASAQQGTAGGDPTGERFQAGLGANWVPDLFGARRAALDASAAAARASAATLGDVQVQVATEVALGYIGLRATQTRLALARDNLANQQETLQITDWRRQAGLVSTLEVDQARAAVAQTEALLPTLQTRVTQGRHALALLAGLAPASLLGESDEPTPLAVPVAPDGLALEIPAETLRQRADVRAAEHEVAAALARVGQARAQRWPSFAIGGSVGLNALTLGALGQGASVVSSLLASVNLPLFDGGALRAQVRVQQAALEQAREAHRAAVLAALRDVEDALVALQGDRLRLVSLRVAAEAAVSASQLARQRFGSGLVDFQTVLDTQRTQFSAQDAVVSASADLGNDHVNLFKALGGGWREAPTPARSGPTP